MSARSTSTSEAHQPRSMFSTTATSAKTSRADYVSAGSGETTAAAEGASDLVESNIGMFLCKHVGCILHSTIHAVPEGRSHREHASVCFCQRLMIALPEYNQVTLRTSLRILTYTS